MAFSFGQSQQSSGQNKASARNATTEISFYPKFVLFPGHSRSVLLRLRFKPRQQQQQEQGLGNPHLASHSAIRLLLKAQARSHQTRFLVNLLSNQPAQEGSALVPIQTRPIHSNNSRLLLVSASVDSVQSLLAKSLLRLELVYSATWELAQIISSSSKSLHLALERQFARTLSRLWLTTNLQTHSVQFHYDSTQLWVSKTLLSFAHHQNLTAPSQFSASASQNPINPPQNAVASTSSAPITKSTRFEDLPEPARKTIEEIE